MCGISGIYNPEGSSREDKDSVKLMTRSLTHRGPDAEGFYFDRNISLGHRRLSIIDISSSSNQPMVYEKGNYVIVFNGEIFNFLDLKESNPRLYKTNSDTEVILSYYQKYGPECVNYFKGQFAFAIWDKNKSNLFLARDRFGEKPLYYFRKGRKLFFSSELRSLLKIKECPKDLSIMGLNEYLSYESPRCPNSLIDGINQIPPAHWCYISEDKFEMNQYWDISNSDSSDNKKNYPEICEDVRGLLTQSVNQQMISDVPIGAFLSGGIDSSMIVSLMSNFGERKIKSLSFSFEDINLDESRFSNLVATTFNTDHTNLVLKPENLLDSIPYYLDSIDVPSLDGPNTFLISKLARDLGLKVALTGIGGDEIFGGYKYFKLYNFYKNQPWIWKIPKGNILNSLSNIKTLTSKRKLSKLIKLLELKPNEHFSFYRIIRSNFLEQERKKLLTESYFRELEESMDLSYLGKSFGDLSYTSQYSILETRNYLLDVLLKDSDNMSMASSLELRSPFLDHELITYLNGLTNKVIYPNKPKKLLVDSFEGVLPDEVIYRKKMGFTFPWNNWLRNELKDFCYDSIKLLYTRNEFNKAELSFVLDQFFKKKSLNWESIWSLVVLSNWLEKNSI